ncbi:MAG: hypothetical protein PVF09_03775 [Desulfobacterales bacterium]
MGGDSDTMACIAGGIAQAYYDQIPADIILQVHQRLPEAFYTSSTHLIQPAPSPCRALRTQDRAAAWFLHLSA